jgi:hypothetical protein
MARNHLTDRAKAQTADIDCALKYWRAPPRYTEYRYFIDCGPWNFDKKAIVFPGWERLQERKQTMTTPCNRNRTSLSERGE